LKAGAGAPAASTAAGTGLTAGGSGVGLTGATGYGLTAPAASTFGYRQAATDPRFATLFTGR